MKRRSRSRMPKEIAKLARQQRMRDPKKVEDLLRGKTIDWMWDNVAEFVAIGESKMGFVSIVPGRLRPGRLGVSIWERDPKAYSGARLLYAKRYKATHDNLKKLVNLVVTWVPGRYHWQVWEALSFHCVRAGWDPDLRKGDVKAPILLSKRY